MRVHTFNTDPQLPYDGPNFDEFCISEGRYLPADRDRTPCITCPLSNLCQTGFEEQVRRVMVGENPSLTEGCAFDNKALEPMTLLSGLTEEQKSFVMSKIPELSQTNR